MAVSKIESTLDVVQATTQRIKNAFGNGCKVYLSFSCGKDSLCMANITYELIRMGEINPKQLTVVFVDEEGLYKSMVEAAERWRKKFLSVGAEFLWLCLPFKQVSVLNHLSVTESWITWEPGKEDVWMRKPPPYAIMHSKYIKRPGQMNYQSFCGVAFADGIQMIGLRTTESVTRYKSIARANMNGLVSGGKFYPIYDWTDTDVWMYIRDHNLEFPEIYMRLYEAGVQKSALRLCAFFGDMTTQGLRWVAETDPELWQRIERREPNAYLVMLYWDSEMFRRQSKKRTELESEQTKKDYRALVADILFGDTSKYAIQNDTMRRLGNWRSLYIKSYGQATDAHYKRMYEGLLYGDPKGRILRILWTQVFNDYANSAKKEERNGRR
ncbi:MAG: phosphoadenosine phosphosulfate reductase family protein [Bacteroidaceae bacterium]|nr:phosphoadenosine phosphosulfate reductase family protein [Bacteroidaceae bacterium]